MVSSDNENYRGSRMLSRDNHAAPQSPFVARAAADAIDRQPASEPQAGAAKQRLRERGLKADGIAPVDDPGFTHVVKFFQSEQVDHGHRRLAGFDRQVSSERVYAGLYDDLGAFVVDPVDSTVAEKLHTCQIFVSLFRINTGRRAFFIDKEEMAARPSRVARLGSRRSVPAAWCSADVMRACRNMLRKPLPLKPHEVALLGGLLTTNLEGVARVPIRLHTRNLVPDAYSTADRFVSEVLLVRSPEGKWGTIGMLLFDIPAMKQCTYVECGFCNFPPPSLEMIRTRG